MASKSRRSKRKYFISPINPSLHYIIFLVMAFILVVVVAQVTKQVSSAARARLLCPLSQSDQTQVVQELSSRCPVGIKYERDNNGCGIWVCKNTPVKLSASPKP